ncbi:unnamed protein product [Amoebophrya sp. A25]|nr:unnamed protein product [Amoebophrya sp. A25]|eukprot:GSA25T00010000001.1
MPTTTPRPWKWPATLAYLCFCRWQLRGVDESFLLLRTLIEGQRQEDQLQSESGRRKTSTTNRRTVLGNEQNDATTSLDTSDADHDVAFLQLLGFGGSPRTRRALSRSIRRRFQIHSSKTEKHRSMRKDEQGLTSSKADSNGASPARDEVERSPPTKLSSRKNRIALCLTGSACFLQNPAIYLSLKKNLVEPYAHHSDFYIFWIFTKFFSKAEESDLVGSKSHVEQLGETNARDYESWCDEDSTDLSPAGHALEPVGWMRHAGHGNYSLSQSATLAQCSNEVHEYEKRSGGVKFDYVMRSRTDLLFTRRFPSLKSFLAMEAEQFAEDLKSKMKTIFLVGDLFLFGPRDEMLLVLELTWALALKTGGSEGAMEHALTSSLRGMSRKTRYAFHCDVQCCKTEVFLPIADLKKSGLADRVFYWPAPKFLLPTNHARWGTKSAPFSEVAVARKRTSSIPEVMKVVLKWNQRRSDDPAAVDGLALSERISKPTWSSRIAFAEYRRQHQNLKSSKGVMDTMILDTSELARGDELEKVTAETQSKKRLTSLVTSQQVEPVTSLVLANPEKSMSSNVSTSNSRATPDKAETESHAQHATSRKADRCIRTAFKRHRDLRIFTEDSMGLVPTCKIALFNLTSCELQDETWSLKALKKKENHYDESTWWSTSREKKKKTLSEKQEQYHSGTKESEKQHRQQIQKEKGTSRGTSGSSTSASTSLVVASEREQQQQKGRSTTWSVETESSQQNDATPLTSSSLSGGLSNKTTGPRSGATTTGTGTGGGGYHDSTTSSSTGDKSIRNATPGTTSVMLVQPEAEDVDSILLDLKQQLLGHGVVAVQLSTAVRTPRPQQAAFLKLKADRESYSFLGETWQRKSVEEDPRRIEAMRKHQGSYLGPGFSLSNQFRDVMASYAIMSQLEQWILARQQEEEGSRSGRRSIKYRGMYVVEDDTLFCLENFAALADLLDYVRQEVNPGRNESEQVRLIMTGLGASGFLFTPGSLSWFYRGLELAYLHHNGSARFAPDTFVLGSSWGTTHPFRRSVQRHTFTLKVTLNAHLPGPSVSGWDPGSANKIWPECFEYACAHQATIVPFDFEGCTAWDGFLYSPQSSPRCIRANAATASQTFVTRLKGLMRGFSGICCRQNEKLRNVLDPPRPTTTTTTTTTLSSNSTTSTASTSSTSTTIAAWTSTTPSSPSSTSSVLVAMGTTTSSPATSASSALVKIR